MDIVQLKKYTEILKTMVTISRWINGNTFFINTFLERCLLAVLYIPPVGYLSVFLGSLPQLSVGHFALPAVRYCCHE